MILHGIKTNNFMSLRDCSIDGLDDHLNFLVGPNGCGKSTVFRALKFIRDRFDSGRTVPFNLFCTRGISPQEIDLTIDVEFNTPWEQELIAAFLCGSFSKFSEIMAYFSKMSNAGGVTDGGIAAFSRWLLEALSPKEISFLFRGKICLSYRSQIYDGLSLSYIFQCGSSPITIALKSIDGVLFAGNMAENRPSVYYPATSTLFDFFDQNGSFNDIKSILAEQVRPTARLDAVACILYLADKAVVLGLDGTNTQDAYFPAYKRFAELSDNLNAANLPTRSFSFSYVLQIMLKRAFVFTNNLRMPIAENTLYTWEEITKRDLNFDNERQIPLLLYYLKNGDFPERERFKSIQEAFKKLAGEDLGFDIYANSCENNQQPHLSVDVRVTDLEGEIPLAYHGAGIWEALMLCTILDESEGKVVLLDEPASNLHPGRQHKLVEVLHGVPGQVIVVTHSAHILPTVAEDFCKVRRMQKISTETIVKGRDSSSWLKLEKLEQELNKSSDLAGLLFADGVILVEGETEIGALREWFPKSAVGQKKTFADLNFALSWTGGKTGFAFSMHFLNAFGIPWAAICDGDALHPMENKSLWKALKDLELIDTIPNGISFEDWKNVAKQAGVYTANASSTESFEDISEVKDYKSSNEVHCRGKVQRGHYIAERIPCPDVVEEMLRLALQRLSK